MGRQANKVTPKMAPCPKLIQGALKWKKQKPHTQIIQNDARVDKNRSVKAFGRLPEDVTRKI